MAEPLDIFALPSESRARIFEGEPRETIAFHTQLPSTSRANTIMAGVCAAIGLVLGIAFIGELPHLSDSDLTAGGLAAAFLVAGAWKYHRRHVLPQARALQLFDQGFRVRMPRYSTDVRYDEMEDVEIHERPWRMNLIKVASFWELRFRRAERRFVLVGVELEGRPTRFRAGLHEIEDRATASATS